MGVAVLGKDRSVTGKLAEGITYREGRDGKKSFAAFCLVHNHKMLACKAFDALADRIGKLRPKETVCLRGYSKPDEPDVFYVTHLALEEPETAQIKTVVIQTAKEKAASIAYDKKLEAQWNVARCYVEPEKAHFTVPLSDCMTMPDGRRIPKLFFCLEILGDKVVHDAIKDAGFTSKFDAAGVKRYNEFKEKLVDYAIRSTTVEKPVEELPF